MNKAGETEQTVVENQKEVTSHTAEAESEKGDGSKALGRFSSADELLGAYNSLESEFTRRCQKLKELERENERLKDKEQSKMNSVEKDFQRGRGFKEKYPETNEILPSLYEIAANSGDDAEGFLERAYVNYLKGEIENQKNYYSSDGYILEKAGNTQAVKDEIIREYLMGINDSKPKVGRFKGNGESVITPPSKPKTLSDASRIANLIFEMAKEIK